MIFTAPYKTSWGDWGASALCIITDWFKTEREAWSWVARKLSDHIGKEPDMDQIGEAIGMVKQHTYRIRSLVDAINRTAPTYALGAQDPLEALRQIVEEAQAAIEAYEAWYRGDEDEAMPRMRTIPVRSPSPDPEKPPAGLAGWAGHGCAGQSNSAMPGASRRIRTCDGRAHLVYPTQRSDDPERDGLAGAASGV